MSYDAPESHVHFLVSRLIMALEEGAASAPSGGPRLTPLGAYRLHRLPRRVPYDSTRELRGEAYQPNITIVAYSLSTNDRLPVFVFPREVRDDLFDPRRYEDRNIAVRYPVLISHGELAFRRKAQHIRVESRPHTFNFGGREEHASADMFFRNQSGTGIIFDRHQLSQDTCRPLFFGVGASDGYPSQMAIRARHEHGMLDANRPIEEASTLFWGSCIRVLETEMGTQVAWLLQSHRNPDRAESWKVEFETVVVMNAEILDTDSVASLPGSSSDQGRLRATPRHSTED